MLSGWRRLNGAHRIEQTRFQSRMLLQVEPLGLPAIRLILVDRSEIGFLSHCLPSPFSVTEANGSQIEFVPWRSQKEKALSLPLLVRMRSSIDTRLPRAGVATCATFKCKNLSAQTMISGRVTHAHRESTCVHHP